MKTTVKHRSISIYLFSLFVLCSLACVPDSGVQQGKQGQGTKLTNVAPGEVKQLLQKDDNLVVLDVRTPAEFEKGHLKNALNIDFLADDFEKQLGELDKDKTYLLYCKTANRSGKAVETMRAKGFRTLYHSTSGFDVLKQAGLPVEDSSPKFR
jgi:phage shock protein E